jgi:hypothetical protein
VEITRYEFALLERALADDHERRNALIDSGWDDVSAAADFATWRSSEARQALEALRERPSRGTGGDLWELGLARMFWDAALTVLVGNPVKPDVLAEGNAPVPARDEGGSPEEAPDVGSGNVGGGNRKQHPRIALLVAAN